MKIPNAVVQAIAEVARTAYCLACGGCPGDFAPKCKCANNPRAMADGCPACKP